MQQWREPVPGNIRQNRRVLTGGSILGRLGAPSRNAPCHKAGAFVYLHEGGSHV